MFYVCAHDTSLQAAVAFCTALVRVRWPSITRNTPVLTLHCDACLQNDKLADSSQPVILRIAAASYLASFLVRVANGSNAVLDRWRSPPSGRLARRFCRRPLCCSTWPR